MNNVRKWIVIKAPNIAIQVTKTDGMPILFNATNETKGAYEDYVAKQGDGITDEPSVLCFLETCSNGRVANILASLTEADETVEGVNECLFEVFAFGVKIGQDMVLKQIESFRRQEIPNPTVRPG
ncbi:MAG TPA: hypothetical protein VJI33_00905 [Candidatus Paceibacterota bacterium]